MTSSPGSINPMNALSIPGTIQSLSSKPHKIAATFVCASGDRNLSIGVKSSPKEWRIGVCDSFLQSWSSLLFASADQSAGTLRDSRVLAFVGEYWLQSTLFRASFAASRTNLGGLYPLVNVRLVSVLHFQSNQKRLLTKSLVPCSLGYLTLAAKSLREGRMGTPIGCLGDAAAASLTIDLVWQVRHAAPYEARGILIPDILFLTRDSSGGSELLVHLP